MNIVVMAHTMTHFYLAYFKCLDTKEASLEETITHKLLQESQFLTSKTDSTMTYMHFDFLHEQPAQVYFCPDWRHQRELAKTVEEVPRISRQAHG